jgi:hypothetical protein
METSTPSPAPIARRKSSAPIFILLALILLGGAFALYKLTDKPEREFEVVDVTGAATPEDRLPRDFPRDIPVDLTTILRANAASHEFGAVAQSEVLYLSYQPIETEAQTYRAYMEARDLILIEDNTLEGGQVVLFGQNQTHQLSVVITPETEEGAGNEVLVSYFDMTKRVEEEREHNEDGHDH